MKLLYFLIISYLLLAIQPCTAQQFKSTGKFTHADTLRGSINPERAWWDVIRYSISVRPEYDKKFIQGNNEIKFLVIKAGKFMQIDLQEPMIIKGIYWKNKKLKNKREGNVFHVEFPRLLNPGEMEILKINFEGHPRLAVNPPWDGGWIFTKDEMGRPWMTVACQGLGASVWYPCKDHQSDEPDSGVRLNITVPDSLIAVGNGRLKMKDQNRDGTVTFHWQVVNPINNYDIIPYVGKYVSWHKDYLGEKGKLDCDFWVLDYNLEKAKKQFIQVDSMLHCFEYWMGPYPFYTDGYKLVEAPHLGMEHQSAIAYGNKYQNGYLGKDLSRSGWGLKWDFIIVHESGHEWFGNNITTKDLADMWVHEGFANYSETLYTTCLFGVEAGDDYCIGTQKRIKNDKPIIASYGVNQEGSGDMYSKGGNLLHMIRKIINDDEKFREILRGLNKDYYHQTVTTQQIEKYFSEHARKNFSKMFDQYLRTTQIPVFEYKIDKNAFRFRWTDCIQGFNMPVKVKFESEFWIEPTEDWQTIQLTNENFGKSLLVDRNFYVRLKKLE